MNRRNRVLQGKVSQEGRDAEGCRGCRLDETEVRPGQYKQKGEKNHEQEANPEPDKGRRENPGTKLQEIGGTVQANWTDAFHAFAQQNVASGSEYHHKKDENVGFQVEFRK